MHTHAYVHIHTAHLLYAYIQEHIHKNLKPSCAHLHVTEFSTALHSISGPIADEPPFIDPYNPGKFGVVNQGGELVALQPKIITSYDIAPPPVEGQTAQMVRQVKLKQSAPLDIYSEPHDTVRREVQNVCVQYRTQ